MHFGCGLGMLAGLSAALPKDAWAVLGYCGQSLFFCRFVVQWVATERRKQVTIPASFWWLSLGGSSLVLAYAIHKLDGVFIMGQAISWVPYVRNLRIHYRQQATVRTCPSCSTVAVKGARYCHSCGQPMPGAN